MFANAFLFFLVGCGTQEVEQRSMLNDFLYEHGGRVDGLQAVMVLTDNGCLGCNKTFSEFITRYIEDPRVCIIVSAAGQHFDISVLLEHKDQVVWDDASAFKNLGFLTGTGAVLLNTHEIDTVIPMHPEDIASSLGYIETRLK